MSRITVIGGTGYAGSAIVAEAAHRGHHVTAVSRSIPSTPTQGVDYLAGDATDERVLAEAVGGADVVVAALAPRGALTARFREVNRTVASLADTARARLFIVGGYSSLRPEPGADRFVTDLTHVPESVRDEVLAGAALIQQDLPTTPASLNWVFVSPPLHFGAHAPTPTTGTYRVGGDVAIQPHDGGTISAVDYARGLIDLVEAAEHHREQVNLAQ